MHTMMHVTAHMYQVVISAHMHVKVKCYCVWHHAKDDACETAMIVMHAHLFYLCCVHVRIAHGYLQICVCVCAYESNSKHHGLGLKW